MLMFNEQLSASPDDRITSIPRNSHYQHAKDQDDHLQESRARSIVSHTSAPQNLIQYFRNQYQVFGRCLDFQVLHRSQKLRLKKYKQAIYYGEIVNGKRHGNGVMLYDNTRAYEGSWENDYKHGEGFQKFPNECVYQGDYVNGKPEGVGKYNWPNGEFYQGEWINGLKHGSGLWQGAKGDSYAGEWKYGKADGYGVHHWINGDKYQGQFRDCLKHGQGMQKFANGDIYKGNYANGKPSGFGEYFWKNGSYFKGMFKNGLRDGHGLWKRGAGNTDNYEGQYKNDKKSGYGIFTWATGNVYKGNYECDNRNGFGEMYWSDESFYKGNWKDGVQNGNGEIYIIGEGFRKGIFQNNELIILQKQSKKPENPKYFERSNPSISGQSVQDPEKSRISHSKSAHKHNAASRVSKVSSRSPERTSQNTGKEMKIVEIMSNNSRGSRYNRQYSSINHPPSSTLNISNPAVPKRFQRESKFSTLEGSNAKPKTSKRQRILHSSFYMHKIGLKNRTNKSTIETRDMTTKIEGSGKDENKGDMIQEMKLFAKAKMSRKLGYQKKSGTEQSLIITS